MVASRGAVFLGLLLGMAACDDGDGSSAGGGGVGDASGGGGAGGGADDAGPDDGGHADACVPGERAPKVDFLFVVDSSGSMCEEQSALSEAFARIAATLVERRFDYRIAVATTDMRDPEASGRFSDRPAPPQPAINCVDDQGVPRTPDTADCAPLLDAGGRLALGPILASGPGGNVSDAADLALKFRCLSTVGTQGDGFEKGLEAMRVALSCDGPNAAAFGPCCRAGLFDAACAPGAAATRFLRPDASLAVVFVSDEADCSDPASNPTRSRRAICRHGPDDGDGDGIPDGFGDPTLCADGPRGCYERECGARTPAECHARCAIARDDNANCEWYRDDLTPVADYRDFLASLKPRGLEQVVVGAIVGRRAFMGTPSGPVEVTYNLPATPSNAACDPASPAYDPDLDPLVCCPNGRCEGPPQPTCESALGIAFSGRRYDELAAELGPAGIGCFGPDDDDCPHICSDDLEPALRQVVEKFAAVRITCP